MTAGPKMAPDLAAVIVDPLAYGAWQPLLDAFATLRRDAPIALAEIPGYRPFWVVTRHADILKISKDNATFLNNPATVVLAPVMAEMFGRAEGCSRGRGREAGQMMAGGARGSEERRPAVLVAAVAGNPSGHARHDRPCQ